MMHFVLTEVVDTNCGWCRTERLSRVCETDGHASRRAATTDQDSTRPTELPRRSSRRLELASDTARSTCISRAQFWDWLMTHLTSAYINPLRTCWRVSRLWALIFERVQLGAYTFTLIMTQVQALLRSTTMRCAYTITTTIRRLVHCCTKGFQVRLTLLYRYSETTILRSATEINR